MIQRLQEFLADSRTRSVNDSGGGFKPRLAILEGRIENLL